MKYLNRDKNGTNPEHRSGLLATCSSDLTRGYAASGARKKIRGCIYARFSTRFQHSIADQVRTCLDWAAKNDVEIDEQHHIYSDEGQSGKKRRRAGLMAMMAALEAGELDVVITVATNRLHRKVHMALQFVEESIVEKRRRCVFVHQNIDTQNTQSWKQLLCVFAVLDEFQVTMSAGHIRSAQEGLLLGGFVHGTVTYGFKGIVVEGPATKLGKPRQKWAIDTVAAVWIKRIFEWFDHDHLDYHEIARRLRRENAPPPTRAEKWSWLIVRRVLKNRRYIGDWSYGVNDTIWQSQADYGRRFPRAEPRLKHQDDSLASLMMLPLTALRSGWPSGPNAKGASAVIGTATL